MTKDASCLSLEPLPASTQVKLTITVSAELKAQFDAYAEVHGRLHPAPVDAAALVTHMLAAFMARGRGFRRARMAPKA